MQTVENQLALRLGLAAKAIDSLSIEKFLQLLVDRLGEPLTERKLRGLTPKPWFQWLQAVSSDIERAQANHALAILTNETVSDMSAPTIPNLPAITAPKLRVAVSSNSGEEINGHFGSCLRFLIYDVSAEHWRLVDVRPVTSIMQGQSRTESLIAQLADCQLLTTLSIGGPSAARVTRANIHPIKYAEPIPCAEVMTKIQTVIRSKPPKWIQKRLEQSCHAANSGHQQCVAQTVG